MVVGLCIQHEVGSLSLAHLLVAALLGSVLVGIGSVDGAGRKVIVPSVSRLFLMVKQVVLHRLRLMWGVVEVIVIFFLLDIFRLLQILGVFKRVLRNQGGLIARHTLVGKSALLPQLVDLG